MKLRFLPTLAIAALCLAAPAAAEKAEVTPDGRHYCSPNYAIMLRETARPGVASLTYPAFFGAKFETREPANSFVAPTGSFDGNIRVVLGGTIGRDGKPLSPLAVTVIKVTIGTLAAPLSAPPGRMTIAIEAGGVKLPAMPVDPAAYRSLEASASVHLAAPGDVPLGRVSAAVLSRMAAAIDGKSPTAILMIDGKAVARMSYEAASIEKAKAEGLAWARRTAPLLAKGDCGN